MGQGWEQRIKQLEERIKLLQEHDFIKRLQGQDFKGKVQLLLSSLPRSFNDLKALRENSQQLLHLPRFLFSPILWMVLFLFSSLPAFAFLYFYQHYTSVVDERIKVGFVERTVDLYTPPFLLKQKQRLSKEKFTTYLKQIGYQPVSGQLKPGSYKLTKDSLSLMPPDDSASAMKIDFSDRGDQISIDRMVDLSKGGEQETYELPGLLLGSFSGTERSRRQPLEFSQIPKPVIDAILAIEDRRFFEHPGIDYRGILRALKVNYEHGEVVQGGSTITQQVIKNTFRMGQRTFQRKFEEAFLALALERRMSKQDILTLYVNEIYLGQQGDIAIRGFGEAANFYFGKDLQELSLPEVAFLAGLIRGPSYYSPVQNPERALTRRNEVLRAMLDQRIIEQGEYDQALQKPLKISQPKVIVPEAPYFFDYASAQLQELQEQLPKYGRYRSIVTLDPQLQGLAEKAVAKHLDRLRRARRSQADQLQAALVALDPRTGDVLAMVGGRDYSNSGFNRASAAMRQPGSAFKPFVYTAAFSSGRFNPGSIIKDEEQVFVYDDGKEYEPKNYGGKFSGGDVTLRAAFARSLNTVTVDLALQVGLENIASVAERAGLHKPKPYPSMALGTFETTPLELAAAYGVFPNGGQYVSPRALRSVTARDGTLLVSPSQTVRSVCSPAVAYLMTDMMESVINEGTARGAGWLRSYSAIAGKTGTSTDGWFIGYTPKLVVAVWVGYDNNHDLKMTGSESALPIWEDFLRDALDIRPELRAPKFKRPADVLEVKLDADTGYLATDYCEHTRTELVASGFEPLPCDHATLVYHSPMRDPTQYLDQDPNQDLETYPFDEEINGSSDNLEGNSESKLPSIVNVKEKRVLVNSDFEKEPKGFVDKDDKDELKKEDEDH